MVRPLIGVSCGYHSQKEEYVLSSDYVNAVEAAGGVPVMVPPLDDPALVIDRINQFDGWILPGGGDPDPVFFGEEPIQEMGPITPRRDVMELALSRAVLEADQPLLAICRGAQILNLAAGGTIHQDLRTAGYTGIKHRQQAPRWYPTHSVRLERGRHLLEWFDRFAGEFSESLAAPESKQSETKRPLRRFRVNSFHHQAIGELAPGFEAAAFSEDGLIEAVESRVHRYVVGVQWHPEAMAERYQSFLGLFEQFVAACASE